MTQTAVPPSLFEIGVCSHGAILASVHIPVHLLVRGSRSLLAAARWQVATSPAGASPRSWLTFGGCNADELVSVIIRL